MKRFGPTVPWMKMPEILVDKEHSFPTAKYYVQKCHFAVDFQYTSFIINYVEDNSKIEHCRIFVFSETYKDYTHDEKFTWV